ncbi:tRNA(Ile)-lysidine synthase [Buchnera aphidicola (Periphyllus testudinaceus)]|uniref:tRNA lysidine(34) synthetase TilS n=1 Tax=Buchnera aphidicola TaxID=9 RepID=UPI003464A460
MINFKKKISKYKKFLVAYSGGIDSTVLLYKLLEIKKKKNIKIRAIHINHQIYKESKKWSKHCKKICIKNKIKFIEEKIFLKKKNIESQARKKRYQIFKKNLLSEEILLTGHNLDDQCETLILSIKRGSGPKGLSSISYKKKFFKNILIRPLLEFSRSKIEKWAKKKKLKWINDHSNNNLSYDRNFIRHKIMPIIKKRWKFFPKNCLRTTQLIHNEHKLLNNFIHPIIKKNLYKKKALYLKNIKKLNIKMQYFIIRKWINIQKKKLPSLIFLKNIIKNVINNKKKKNPKIVLKKYEIWKYQNHLFWIKKKPTIKNYIIFWHPPFKKLILPKNFGYLKMIKKKYSKNKLYIKKPKKNQLIIIKFQTNKKIQTHQNKTKKKIKKIFNEFKIPPWKRKKIPLLFYNNKLISIIGIIVTKKKYNIKEKKISVIWNK